MLFCTFVMVQNVAVLTLLESTVIEYNFDGAAFPVLADISIWAGGLSSTY